MHGIGRAGAHLGEIVALEDVEDLDHMRRRRTKAAAWTRCRSRDSCPHRLALDRLVGLQVVERHSAARALHGRDDALGGRALVETGRSIAGDAQQRLRQVGLHQRVARLQGRVVGPKKIAFVEG